MPESKAKEVARLFGLELEEEFTIKGSLHNYKFTEEGLKCWKSWGTEWIPDDPNWLIVGKCTIIKHKPILTDMEKEYLSNIIKPFRDKVIFIKKIRNTDDKHERIGISVCDYNNFPTSMMFPHFEKEKMYKRMKLNKEYTLDELEL